MFRTLVIVSLLLFSQAALSQSKKKPLSDDAMDRVTAAGVNATVSQGVVKFSGQTPTPNGLVSAAGTLAVTSAPISGTTIGTLNLNGNAQQNLSSLVNINAVNSVISVLLNLNINIDSTVGTVVQSNLTGETLMPSRISVLGTALMSFTLLLTPARAQTSANEAGVVGEKPIRTLKEIRNEGVVRQRWDLSCGAAALSTLLTYDFKDNTPESAIVVWILHRTNPALVRARGGFSLLDLKHFVQARGYQAEAFSDMSLQELAGQKSSVIVPVRLKGFDHFVVVKYIDSDRVFLADPGFGNVTMKANRFKEIWKNGIVFIVLPPDQRMQMPKSISTASTIVPDETLITREIGITTPTNGLY